ncbi:MAG: ATP-binding protein [Candidatus Omnitrophota bacterium]
MKQIVIISGKGGTGKTILTGALAALAKNACFADCDVDAADLHLLLHPQIKEKYEFRSGKTARINPSLCNNCGNCFNVCRFFAVKNNASIEKSFMIDPIDCEGCGFCSFICPKKAIIMQENLSGHWFISDTRFGPMVHAKLGIAEENSGKLVSLVRNRAKQLAEENNYNWVIIDGAPGIGCPVIASLSGIDLALVVTEPTLSGLHDAMRVIEVTQHFNVPVRLIINKYDLNINMSEKIEKFCFENNIKLSGKICFDKSVVKAMVEGKTIIEYDNSPVKKAIIDIWERLKQEINT